MKMLTKEAVASVLLLGVLAAGSAQARVENISLNGLVGVGGATLSARVEDGVAIVYGEVESGAEAALAYDYVASIEGVDEVLEQVSIK